jgi:hypothetical protein
MFYVQSVTTNLAPLEIETLIWWTQFGVTKKNMQCINQISDMIMS